MAEEGGGRWALWLRGKGEGAESVACTDLRPSNDATPLPARRGRGEEEARAQAGG